MKPVDMVATVEMSKIETSEECNSNRPLGPGGLPFANPMFPKVQKFHDQYRRPRNCISPGPNVPHRWWDSGIAWPTRYFADVVPVSRETKTLGKYRCQIPLQDGRHCNFEVADEHLPLTCGPCWSTSDNALTAMEHHLASFHGIKAPERTAKWSSALFDRGHCLDAWFCSPCSLSRVLMATAGWSDEVNVPLAVLFTLLSDPFHQGIFTAVQRHQVVTLGSIDESACQSVIIGLCCSPCSSAQVLRELGNQGVWPGSQCGDTMPLRNEIAKMM